MKSLRTMWKGVLAIGKERIPVKLYAAASNHTVRFRLLHRKDQTPVKQQMVADNSETVIEKEERTKAAEVEPGLFVMLTQDELEDLKPEPSREITVSQFVPRAKVNHMWYNRPYYLAPDGDEDAYWALVEELEDGEREAIARWVMRNKEYVGSLSVYNGCLDLVTLRYEEEVVEPDEIPARFRGEPNKNEEKMANQLVEMLESDFEPEEYRDAYHDQVLDLIEAKAKGKKPDLEKPKRKKQSGSLADALKSSIADAKK
ncbi:MAG: Ku protein [Spirochaetales bacterium]